VYLYIDISCQKLYYRTIKGTVMAVIVW